jgi:Schlafen group 3, DNA/RNA helicase domain
MPEQTVPYGTPGFARFGWASSFPEFRAAPAHVIRESLERFISDVSPEQRRAWDQSIPPLQSEVGQTLTHHREAADYSTILEYELPMEFRRPDVVFLAGGGVLVLELKGKSWVDQADLDQVSAYRRDLLAYHRDCAERPVDGALVLVGAKGRLGEQGGIHVVGIDAVDELVDELDQSAPGTPVEAEHFLQEEAYRPLPSLIEAARVLMETGDLPYIKRAKGATAPALAAISEIAREAARTETRRLVLLTGIPGAGKTLVGLQLAHARFLDDLAVQRPGRDPMPPAVFLSGNGPLVEVLQYELKDAGGDGKAFVRGVKEYVDRYSKRPDLAPSEHVLIFDEAQRAWDAAQVADKHGQWGVGRSEPDHFIEFAERIPSWCVVVGLVGSGQEIHIGEEAGVGQWARAVEHSAHADTWTIHADPVTADSLATSARLERDPALQLTIEVRYHLAKRIHEYVDGLLRSASPTVLASIAAELGRGGYFLRITRDLATAKSYLRDRFGEDRQARFGLIASSKDKELWRFGVPNDYQSTKRVKNGPWYAEGDDDPLGRSCRTLRECITEFAAQGLELDAALLAWGADFIRKDRGWSNDRAGGYQRKAFVHDPFQLRLNAYRVLLTRARDATVVFVPPIPMLDETAAFLTAAGFVPLDGVNGSRVRRTG